MRGYWRHVGRVKGDGGEEGDSLLIARIRKKLFPDEHKLTWLFKRQLAMVYLMKGQGGEKDLLFHVGAVFFFYLG